MFNTVTDGNPNNTPHQKCSTTTNIAVVKVMNVCLKVANKQIKSSDIPGTAREGQSRGESPAFMGHEEYYCLCLLI